MNIDIVIYTSVNKINTIFNIELPKEFEDGKYHIKTRYDEETEYLSIQNEENYFRIDGWTKEIKYIL